MSGKDREHQEKLIEELVETRARGVTAGICGREWCERCGELGSFSGFCGALGSHLDYNRFTCWSCRTGESEAAKEGTPTKRLDELIFERRYRYCGGCGRETILQKRTVEEARRLPFACPACQGFDRGKVARRRYLEHAAENSGDLEKAAARIRWAKAGIEEILEDSDDAEM